MKENKFLEIGIFLLFCIGTIIIACFHEPWFDELQAWNISKDTISNIIFYLPQYEGHVPLWHLILKCFSSFNVPCEWGIKIPNSLFMFASVWLLIFKSPFPRWVKLSLPFSYFLFYQYSVISRLYSIFCFAIMFAAVFYKTRDEHPFRFILPIILLSCSCVYGMLFSTGILVAWGIEVLNKVGFKSFFKDKRFYSMLTVAFVCLVLTYILIPSTENFMMVSPFKQNLYTSIIYTFFANIADVTFCSFLNYETMPMLHLDPVSFLYYGYKGIITQQLLSFCCCSVFGLFINIVFIKIFKKFDKLSMFLIPYLLFIIFCFGIHCFVHHTGLLFIFLIYSFWCLLYDVPKDYDWKKEKCFLAIVILSLVANIYWAISASALELKYTYYPTKAIANFIKENNLSTSKIMGEWSSFDYNGEDKNNTIKTFNTVNKYKKLHYEYMGNQLYSVPINSYFNKNIFYNFNQDSPERQYMIFQMHDFNSIDLIKKSLKDKGLPDYIVGNVYLDDIFNENNVLERNYHEAKSFSHNQIWKNSREVKQVPFYMRNDLYYEWIKTHSNL